MSSIEGDLKSIVNNMTVNMAGMLVRQKVLQPFLPPSQNEYINMAIGAGVVTSIEEVKALLTRMGFNLNIMQV